MEQGSPFFSAEQRRAVFYQKKGCVPLHRYLLFDLDGTLTDPAEGITKCVQYALAYLGQQERRREELYCYIGPPLPESFEKYGGLSHKEALLAVEKYRERFRTKGMFENRVYPGVEELLYSLNRAGKILAVATSKPEVFAKEILEHFHLFGYFQQIVGSELDGARINKAEVIQEVFSRLSLTEKEKSLAVMVGDRKHDIIGAKKNGIDSVGVAFGYAEDGELEKAGADRVVDSVAALQRLLLEW